MGKIKSLNDINHDIKRQREEGNIIVCACGCFDILHIGHVEYLENSKKLGDILAVGINSDRYMMQHKSRKHFFNQVDRCSVIAALSCVDYVFAFDEETFDRSLEIICPDFFTKGIDRMQVVERKTADRLGIQIQIIGKEKRSSSSELYQELMKQEQ